jgi:hypothetical protein
MGWLLLLAALLGLVFPPLAVVVLAMVVLGVFVKGVAADAQEPIVKARPKVRQRDGAQRPEDAMRHHVAEPQQGTVIDVRCYPFLPPARLETPTQKSPDCPQHGERIGSGSGSGDDQFRK